jgi:periplasmic divalent cation tolerance protein
VNGLIDTSDIVFLYVTFPDRETARKISRAAVENKFAACANIFSDHDSIYRWKNEVVSETETAAILKTVASKEAVLSAYLIRHHPYETPCVVAFSPEKISGPFGEWIRRETMA